MKYLLKFSPEITIKSRPVRIRFVRQLRKNLRTQLKRVNSDIEVESNWDYLNIDVPAEVDLHDVEEVMGHTPGVNSFNRVHEHPLTDLDDVFQHTLKIYGERLSGKTFAVRCKRSGRHTFNSMAVERHVGGRLKQSCDTAGVSLSKPQVLVRLEIRDDLVFVIDQNFPGLGGFPLGTQDSVLSLISGGFDSAVASYMTIRRGLHTHYLFFNLGGREHEMAVKEVALFLWMKYGSSHRVKFITVPFEDVVREILTRIDNPQMGVVLKRMMLRAATKIAETLEIDALVTGECVAQVSSQTLRNLAVIDEVTNALVIRPLAMSDKQEIVDLARKIGTDPFSAAIPEYCGVISVNPTTRARSHRVEREEGRFDFSLLDKAVETRREELIDELVLEDGQVKQAQIYTEIPDGAAILDIRHPDEQEKRPLDLPVETRHLPFYQLASRFQELPKETLWLLYCDKGIMSRLHASWLLEQDVENVAVYRP